MAYSPTMIANNVLSRAFEEKIYVSPMKLQKLLYFIASEYQKRTGKTLLAEPFQTWAYGPVIHSVYDEFRAFSKTRIKRYGRDAEGKAYVIDEAEDIDLRHSMERVWEAAKNMGAVELSEITHREGSAWDKAFQADMALLDPEDIVADNTYRDALGMGGMVGAIDCQ